MGAQSELQRSAVPKAYCICVFVLGKIQKSYLGFTFIGFLMAFLALGVYSDTRVPGCTGAVESDSELLTPALWIALKLWNFMRV